MYREKRRDGYYRDSVRTILRETCAGKMTPSEICLLEAELLGAWARASGSVRAVKGVRRTPAGKSGRGEGRVPAAELEGTGGQAARTTEDYREKLGDGDRPLFDELVRLRTSLAGKEGIPAYIVCSNRSIYEMCVSKPLTEDAFLDIYGIGAKKYDRYGRFFMEVIRQYAA